MWLLPAAAVVAFDTLLDLHISKPDLVRFAAEGEKASAGSLHYDKCSRINIGRLCVGVRPFPTVPEFIHIEPPIFYLFWRFQFESPCKKNRTCQEGFTIKCLTRACRS